MQPELKPVELPEVIVELRATKMAMYKLIEEHVTTLVILLPLIMAVSMGAGYGMAIFFGAQSCHVG